MKFEEASKVFGELKKYRETENESVMKSYSINHLRRALSAYHSDKGWAHYDDLVDYIRQREAEENKINERKAIKWWHDPLFLVIVGAVIGGVITGGISLYIFNVEHQDRKTQVDSLKVIIDDKNSELTKRETEINDLRKINQDLLTKKPEMPVTVIDKDTGNLIHIGKPIPHNDYYEFPVTLIDGKFSGRIDQYRFIDDNTIQLIAIIKDKKK